MRKGVILRFLVASAVAALEVTPGAAFASADMDACHGFLLSGNYPEAIKSGFKAVRKNPKEVKANLCLGIALSRSGRLKEAISYLKKGEKDADDLNDKSDIATVLGGCYHQIGELEAALSHHKRALSIDKQRKDNAAIGTDLNNLASVYQDLGQVDDALKLLEEAIKFDGNDQEMGVRYSNLAVLYGDIGDKKALFYFSKAIFFKERAGDFHGLAITRLNLGEQYRRMGMFDEAAQELEIGLLAIMQVGDRFWQGVAFKYIGWLFLEMKEPKPAEAALEAALAIFKEIGSKTQIDDVRKSIEKLKKETGIHL